MESEGHQVSEERWVTMQMNEYYKNRVFFFLNHVDIDNRCYHKQKMNLIDNYFGIEVAGAVF